MKKKIQRSGAVDMVLPDVINSDELALFTDEDLARRAAVLESDRIRAGEYSLPWEVEIAYVQREQGIRERGHQIHVEYMKGPGALTAED